MNSHGMPAAVFHEVARATTMARLLYAATAWLVFELAADHQRMNRFIQRTVRMVYLPSGQPDAETLVTEAESRLLTSFSDRHYHVHHSSLPLSLDVLVCDLARMTLLCYFIRTIITIHSVCGQ